jgi:multiple sugar transport system permease protein
MAAPRDTTPALRPRPDSVRVVRHGKARRRLIGQILTYVCALIVAVLFVAPLWVMVTVAVMPDSQIFSNSFQLFPKDFLWGNFGKALSTDEMPFLTYLKNTLTYTCLSTLGAVISSSVVAYGFSRITWPGRDILFFVLLSTLMLPFAVIMIPLYVIFADIHWTNTLLPLIVPNWFGVAFYVFLIRQFMLTIPKELSEAATIDGASEWQTYLWVILPIARPALAVVAVFQIVASWNDFFGPLIYLTDSASYTLTLGLQQFQTAHGANWSLLLAASTLFTIPMIVLFLLTQRVILSGLSLTGSVKG